MKLTFYHINMDRVSSQLTIFIRIALPTIWFTTIFSLFILLIWSVQGKAQIFANPIIWIVVLLILGAGYAFVKFILWRLYRVDMDDKNVYVSNYFKTFKYPFTDVESISPSQIAPTRIFIINLKSKGSFGKSIYFLASQRLWTDFLAEHPEIFVDLYQEKDSN